MIKAGDRVAYGDYGNVRTGIVEHVQRSAARIRVEDGPMQGRCVTKFVAALALAGQPLPMAQGAIIEST